MLKKRNWIPKSCRRVILAILFFLSPATVVFSVESIPQLIAQGDAAVADGYFERGFLIGKRIIVQDPKNLQGYGFLMVWCLETKNERSFYFAIDEAKRLGVDEWKIDELAMKLLYLYEQPESVRRLLEVYEQKWRQTYDKSY